MTSRRCSQVDWLPHNVIAGCIILVRVDSAPLNGGIIGTLMDCHSNWTAIWHMINRDGLEAAPPMVTADFHVTMRRPTPTDGPVHLTARAVSSDGPRVRVEATLSGGGRVTATCVGHFVAVEPGHPAHYRW